MAKKLQVIARADSFRRAGFEFTAEPKFLDPKDLTEAQIKALKEEPRLVVVEVDVPEEKDTAKAKAQAAADAKAAEAKAKADAEANARKNQGH